MPRRCSASPIPPTSPAGRSFAQHVEAQDGQSRLDAITRSGHGDTGGGVAYQVQYGFRRGGGETIWLEDTGRWFAGSRRQAGARDRHRARDHRAP